MRIGAVQYDRDSGERLHQAQSWPGPRPGDLAEAEGQIPGRIAARGGHDDPAGPPAAETGAAIVRQPITVRRRSNVVSSRFPPAVTTNGSSICTAPSPNS